MLHVDLAKLAGGTLQEKFDREITRVIQNMQDPNTPFGERRGITISLSFSQNEGRNDTELKISVKTKLAGCIPAKTRFSMGQDLRSGQVVVEEYGKRIPGQMALSGTQGAGGNDADRPQNTVLPMALRADRQKKEG